MILYPLEAVWDWYLTRDLVEPYPPQTSLTPNGGLAFSLHESIMHCGLPGWLGSVASFGAFVWLLAVGALWLSGARRPGVTNSRRLVFAVLVALAAVLATQQAFKRMLGILLEPSWW